MYDAVIASKLPFWGAVGTLLRTCGQRPSCHLGAPSEPYCERAGSVQVGPAAGSQFAVQCVEYAFFARSARKKLDHACPHRFIYLLGNFQFRFRSQDLDLIYFLFPFPLARSQLSFLSSDSAGGRIFIYFGQTFVVYSNWKGW